MHGPMVLSYFTFELPTEYFLSITVLHAQSPYATMGTF